MLGSASHKAAVKTYVHNFNGTVNMIMSYFNHISTWTLFVLFSGIYMSKHVYGSCLWGLSGQ